MSCKCCAKESTNTSNAALIAESKLRQLVNTFSILPDSYLAWTETFAWKSIYGHELLYSGPLFIHQFSHLWIDFRGIQDAFMQEKHSDYFQNSRCATLIQQEYSRQNPLNFDGYCECAWGLTASDGPGPKIAIIDGIERTFFDYVARGAPYGPDDGTIAPWALNKPGFVEGGFHDFNSDE